MRAADGSGEDRERKIVGEAVATVGPADRTVRAVGDDPESAAPGRDGAGAAFALVVEERVRGTDAADAYGFRTGATTDNSAHALTTAFQFIMSDLLLVYPPR